MKHTQLLVLASLLFLSTYVHGNNISVSNVNLAGQNVVAGLNNPANFVMVQFTVSWENSWRTSMGPGNWDAAWVFVKFRAQGGDWQHANLNNAGMIAPSGCTIDPGLQTPGAAFNVTTNPAIGAFVYRNSNGSGTFTATNLQLRWNYGSQNIADNVPVELQVFAIEMVYVPQGAFNAGGGATSNAFTSTTINTANATTTPSGVGSLGGQAGGFPTGQTQPTSASWPNGFAATYCMKYELSQQQYVDFLNTLTRTQQSARVFVNITGTTVANVFVLSNTPTPVNRSPIRCDATIPASPTPVTFYCDLNDNDIGGESGDGQWIAASFVSSGDLLAYLDWSGLRPMTELEYEKICRGTILPVLNEYAWGNALVTPVSIITNNGTVSEGVQPGANANVQGVITSTVRTGVFAGPATNRVQSGATFYGVMEMTGSAWERPISIGTTEGRTFTGTHGNGVLNATGDANESNWPSTISLGFRGGSWQHSGLFNTVSNRFVATTTDPSRSSNYSGRGVRSAN